MKKEHAHNAMKKATHTTMRAPYLINEIIKPRIKSAYIVSTTLWKNL